MARKWKIGVLTHSLKLGVHEGILKSAELGADGVQLLVTHGELFPDNFPGEKRAEFKRFVADQGLEISALCADFNWVKGFTDAEFNKENEPRLKKCVDLACDLETDFLTMHIGHVPADESHPVFQEALRMCTEVGKYAEERGKCLLTETGPEPPANLLDFLKHVPTKGIGVNYDPANLVMCGPFDHIGGVGILKDYIRHTHAKDGICLGKGTWKELPLGEGGVVFPYYLAALEEAGYDGYLTIEREEGEDRVADVAHAVKFLKALCT